MRAIQKLVDKTYEIKRFNKNNSADRFIKEMTCLLRSYFHANRAIHKLRYEILTYNRFWSRYLTVIFATLTAVDSYMILIISSQKSAFEIMFFVFFGVILFVMLFTITYECTVLVDLNCSLLKLQRKFCFHISMICPVKLSVLLKVNY